jgi:ATP-binding cassette subfamily B protein
MGPTGSGKTALLSLIPRFYDATGGSVLVDGVDVRQYALAALRGRIACALQKSELFSGTLRENIAWACPGASEEAIARAAGTACLSGLVEQGLGLDTPGAERGMGLSGGQRQRVALARALLKGGRILLMDDAASALDVETEARLWKNLARDCPGVTKIIVCQRVSTARAADRVVVLEQGRVAGCGRHEDLLRSCPAYREICASQEGGGDGAE